jgi:hypothetical protein
MHVAGVLAVSMHCIALHMVQSCRLLLPYMERATNQQLEFWCACHCASCADASHSFRLTPCKKMYIAIAALGFSMLVRQLLLPALQCSLQLPEICLDVIWVDAM